MGIHHRPAVSLGALLAIVSSSLAISVGDATAKRTDPPGHHDANQCQNPAGVNLNELYGVSDQFRTRDCQELTAGEHWIRPMWWIVNFGDDSVYPDGYVPARPDPIDDFLSKLTIKIVIDAGTPRELVLVYSAAEAARTDIDAEELEPGAWGAPYPMASMLPRVRPLSVGEHVMQPFVVLSAMHCDGFSTDVEFSCLPAGETPFVPPRPLVVSTPAN